MFYIHGDINVRYAGKNQKQSSTVVCRLTSALLCHVSGGNGRSGLLCIFKIPGNAERTWLLGDDYGRYITF